MKKEELRIVFLGTPEFAVESLKALVTHGYNVCAVVTMPDKLAGRGHKILESDVKKYALDAGLPILQPTNLKDPEFIEQLKSYQADLFIVIAFRMLPEVVWRMPRFGTFNLHASLLPRYRGAAPINRAVMNGDKKTGVTTFFLKHEIDTGDIISQREIDIADDENVGSVHDRLMRLGAEVVIADVDEIIASDGNIKVKPQPEGEFLPAPKIFNDTCTIDWNKPREEVRNLIRGLSPYPAARTTIVNDSGKEFILKIFESRIPLTECLEAHNAGEVAVDDKRLIIWCADGPLELMEVQLQGKKRMKTDAFLLGFKLAKVIF